MTEEWLEIKGYEQKYQVSNSGRIKSLVRKVKNKPLSEKIMKFQKDNSGYYWVGLSHKSQKQIYRIHRLVAKAFIPNPNNYPQVNHKDGNKQNNFVDNLEWCNSSQNKRHAVNLGLINFSKGEKHRWSKLTNIEVIQIRELYNNEIFNLSELSKKFNITKSGIRGIVSRAIWKHI